MAGRKMRLGFSTCMVALALAANASAVSTSVAATDPVDTDLAGDARVADAPATQWIPEDRAGRAQPDVPRA